LWGNREGVYESFNVLGDKSPAIVFFVITEMSKYKDYFDIDNQNKSDYIQLCISVEDVEDYYSLLFSKVAKSTKVIGLGNKNP